MADLKLLTARSLKWNAIDRIASQVIYAVVGIVLANILSREEFGLVGALAIFQAFATIFIDSGFGAALLREKDPTSEDYSTVFWFNTVVSLVVYALLYVMAPWIAMMFDNSEVLRPMSRVMFLTFVINGLAIVQTNRLMKRMEVKMIAVANTLALIISGAVGVILAVKGYGAWAMVWYSVVMAAVKTGVLWLTGGWLPTMVFSMATLRKIHRVGASVFSSSLLNTISLNVYNFVIGIFYSVPDLGLYTQADKWSKMGYTSISQTLTSSFVPLLSAAQDSPSQFRRYVVKTGRFTAFILFPAMIGMVLVAEPLFHLLFAHKWDDAIPLFRILALRGIFIVIISLYSNYLLAMGKARGIFASEFIKDVLIFIAILTTFFTRSLTILIIGQLAASFMTWLILLPLTRRSLSLTLHDLLTPLLPFAALTLMAALTAGLPYPMIVSLTSGLPLFAAALLRIFFLSILALGSYLLLLRLFRVPELPEALTYLTGRFRHHRKPHSSH